MPFLCGNALVVPLSLSLTIMETHSSLNIQKKIANLTEKLREYRLQLTRQCRFPNGTDVMDRYDTEYLCRTALVDIKTMKDLAKKTRPPYLTIYEVAMITTQSLLHLTKKDIAIIPEIVTKEQWVLLEAIIKKIE